MKSKQFLSFHLSWLSPLLVAAAIGVGYTQINGAIDRDLGVDRRIAEDGTEDKPAADRPEPVAELEFDADEKATEDFLKRMGFEDFSKMMNESIAKGDFLNPAFSKHVLNLYQQRYQMYNHARMLAVALDETLGNSNRGKLRRENLARFIGEMIDFKPTHPPHETPKWILLEKDENTRNIEGTKYAVKILRDQIQHDIRVLSSDLIKILYSDKDIDEVLKQVEAGKLAPSNDPELKRLSIMINHIEELVRFNYLDAEMGSFALPSLGKALTLCAARRAKLHPSEASEAYLQQVKTAIEARGYHYQNYIGRTLRVMNDKNEIVDVKISNGAHIHELSQGNQSHQIPHFVGPGNPSNWLRAAKYSMFGEFFGVAFSLDREEGEKNAFKRFMSAMAEKEIFRGGVSHIGAAQVLVDPETGLETTRAVDSYIDTGDAKGRKLGGIRVTDIIHQFAKDSEFRKLAVSTYDHKKLFKWFKEYARTVGYKEEFDYGDRVTQKGEVSESGKNSIPWKTMISKADFERWANAPDSMASEFHDELMNKMFDVLINDFLRRGAGFAHGFSNIYGRMYCTKALWLAMMIGMNFDVQKVHDKWASRLHVLAKFKPELKAEIEKGMMDRRILAPAGLSIWNANVSGDVQVVRYPFKSEADREELGYNVQRVAMDAELHERLTTTGLFQKLTQVDPKGLDNNPTDLAIWMSVEASRAANDKAGLNFQGRARRATPLERMAKQYGITLSTAAEAGLDIFAALIAEGEALVDSLYADDPKAKANAEAEEDENGQKEPRRRNGRSSKECIALFAGK